MPENCTTKSDAPGCSDCGVPSWSTDWRQFFQLTKRPNIYAEVALEPSDDFKAIRFRPQLLEFESEDGAHGGPKIHLSFYAAVWLDGIELGVTAFGLPPRHHKGALHPNQFEGHSGLWLPLPRMAGNTTGGLLSVLAVLHQSQRDEPPVEARLARILGTALNARAKSVLLVPPPTTGAVDK